MIEELNWKCPNCGGTEWIFIRDDLRNEYAIYECEKCGNIEKGELSSEGLTALIYHKILENEEIEENEDE